MHAQTVQSLTEDERAQFLELVAAMVDAQFEERLAAYRAGHSDGWIQGYEQCARERLADAETALGRAA